MGESKSKGVLDRAVMFLANFAFAVLVITVLLQVAGRHILARPIVGTEEMSRILYVWLTFIGAGAIIRTREHITVTFMIDRISYKWRRRLAMIVHVFSLLFFIYVFFSSLDMVMQYAGVPLPSVPYITLSNMYLAVTVGSVITIYFLIEGIILDITSKQKLDLAVEESIKDEK